MSTQIRPAPVRKRVFVNAPQAHAFDVFTSGIGRWWPKSHKIGEFRLAHTTPRHPSFELHAAAELFAQLFALRLEIDRLKNR